MKQSGPAEFLGVPLNDLHLWGGPSRAQAFAALQDGRLDGYRLGRVRLVTTASLRRLIDQAVSEGRVQ